MKKKYTNKLTKKQMRAFIKPMFCGTIIFGYTTPDKVEKYLDKMFGKRSRK